MNAQNFVKQSLSQLRCQLPLHKGAFEIRFINKLFTRSKTVKGRIFHLKNERVYDIIKPRKVVRQ